jgi:hypothetical protein
MAISTSSGRKLTVAPSPIHTPATPDRWRERMGETMRSPVSSDSGWSVWNALGAPATGLSIDSAAAATSPG